VQSSYWSLSVSYLLVVSAAGCGEPILQPSAAAEVDAGPRLPADDDDGSGADLLADAGVQRVAPLAADSGTPTDTTKAASDNADDTTSDSDKCRKFVMPSDCKNPEGRPLPSELRCTGLYGDWEKRALACDVTLYKPAYELWSDGAKKQRWVSLPEGGKIDAAKPEAFAYPVGTQFWKEFRISVQGQDRLAETRLLRKTDRGWVYTSYVWDEKGERAEQTNDGVKGLFGSDYAVPTLEQCKQCHGGREDFVMGWDPILLGPGATGVTLEDLVARGVLQNAKTPAPAIPGVVEHDSRALGYLHVNCGVSCHNPQGDAKDSAFFMRLDTDKLTDMWTTPTLATGLYKVPWENAKIQGLTPPVDQPFVDILLGRPDASLALVRMQTRGSEAQMPPIATSRVDDEGVAIVRKLLE
jgi:YD repeat-containing protein